MNNDYPVLDGIVPSFADIGVKLTPYGASVLDVKDIAAINTNTTVEIGEQRGASGGRVMKRTTGSASHEASWTLYRDGYQKMIRALMAVAPRRGNQALISLVHFDVQVQHTPPGSSESFEYVIKGCRFLGRAMNGAEGPDADKVDCSLNTIQIADIIDGVEVVLL